MSKTQIDTTGLCKLPPPVPGAQAVYWATGETLYHQLEQGGFFIDGRWVHKGWLMPGLRADDQ